MNSTSIWPSYTLDLLLLAIGTSVIVASLLTGQPRPAARPALRPPESQTIKVEPSLVAATQPAPANR